MFWSSCTFKVGILFRQYSRLFQRLSTTVYEMVQHCFNIVIKMIDTILRYHLLCKKPHGIFLCIHFLQTVGSIHNFVYLPFYDIIKDVIAINNHVCCI